MQLDPASGAIAPFINYASSSIDVAWRMRGSSHPQFFLLEYSANLGATPAADGQLLVFNSGDSQMLATGLHGPTGLALDASAGMLYIVSQTDGTILQLNVGQ